MDHMMHNMADHEMGSQDMGSMDHGSMGHGIDHSAMDHSAMGHVMDHSAMGHGSMGHDMGNGTMDMDMAMAFYFGYTDVTVLFKGWVINSIWELCLSMLAIFIISFAYEGLKYGRDYLFRKNISSSTYTSTSKNNITITDGQQPVRMSMCSQGHMVQTLLHMVQFVISYLLMLIFMTYNVWLCLAVLLGSGLGYFTFGWRKSVAVDITEHCH